jgi:alkanesulfonate monooxygenase
MRLCVFIEPQHGASYEDQLAVARRAEECGFDAFFRSDHFLTMGAWSGLPGPTDSWVTLGALARETSTIRLGTLVTSATFRLPGPLAIAVAQVDQMSGGRVDFGLGSGWFEAEHTAYGIPFPPVGERFERLEEQLEIITGLWAADKPYSFTGRHYSVVDSPGLPKPAQRPGPHVVGILSALPAKTAWFPGPTMWVTAQQRPRSNTWQDCWPRNSEETRSV